MQRAGKEKRAERLRRACIAAITEALHDLESVSTGIFYSMSIRNNGTI